MSDKHDKNKSTPADERAGTAEPENAENTENGADTGPEIIEIQPDPQAAEPKPAPDAPAPEDVVEEYDVPKVKDLAEARCILEALLFTTIEPLPLKQLSALLPPLDPHTIRKLIVELQSDYDAHRRGLQIMEVGKGFQMASRPEYGKWVLGLMPHRRKSSLSTAALETLAIIAYKQPITRVEVDQIRGVDSSGTVRNLLDLGLIKAAGQKDAVGRPMLYVTTDHFLKVFGLRRLTDMPSLQELRKRYKSEPENKDEQSDEPADEEQTSLLEQNADAPADSADAAPAESPSPPPEESAGDDIPPDEPR